MTPDNSNPIRRVVVCALGGRRDLLELPESRAGHEREFIFGGERSLYELATAMAALGHEVELRGLLNARILSAITDAAGSSPRVGLEPRRPEPGEVVVLPEGLWDPELYATVLLSGARGVVYLLAPPGLWGWSFLSGWAPPDPMSVRVEEVGKSASFRAIASLGFSMWANLLGVAHAASAAGVEATWVGTGTPVPFPPPPRKTDDLAIVEANRWYPLAKDVASRVPGASILSVPPVGSVYSLCDALAPARILIWPSRIEGMSRIAREARAVGTVPVALDTNPFATRADHGEGVVLVADLEAMAAEASRLLEDADRLQDLSSAASESARAQARWEPFVERVSAALECLPAPDGADARAELGRRIREIFNVRWSRRMMRPVTRLIDDSRTGRMLRALGVARRSRR